MDYLYYFNHSGTAQGEGPGGGAAPPSFVVKKIINLVKYTSKNEK